MKRIFLAIALLSCVNAFCGDIVISKDTTINDVWTIPATTIYRFETGGHISGTGRIQGGILDAAMTQNIFDTTITVNPSGLRNGWFSAAWFGASPSRADNSGYLQKAINTCISSWWLIIPKGKYDFSKMLEVSSIYNGLYVGVTIHISGDGITNFWTPELGTILNYKGSGIAIGLQLNKGTVINNLVIQGGWVSPTGSKMDYNNLTDSNYTDQSGNNYGPSLRGICIDFNSNQNGSVSGSTGIYIYDVIIRNFYYGIIGSLNGTTLNNEILHLNRVQFGDGKYGFVSTQGQEKGNVLENIYSWGAIYCLFSSGNMLNGQGGDYTIYNLNVAGACVMPFNINQRGWGRITISNGFFEQIAKIGIIKGSTSISINNVTFDLAYQSEVGVKTVLETDNYNTVFNNCTIRYFGNTTDTIHLSGNMTFNYSTFGSPIVNTAGMNTVNFPMSLPIRSNIKLDVK